MSAQAATSTAIPIPIPAPTPRPCERWSERARRVRTTGEQQRLTRVADRSREQEELIVKLMGLVRRIAFELREHLPAHVEVDDLVSAGTVGLIDAVKRFQPDKQVKIETYARYRIRGAMLDALRELDSASRDMRKQNKQAEQVFHQLAVKLGRVPADAEMAEALRVSLDDWYGTVCKLQSMGVEWLRPTQMAESYAPDEDSLPDQDQQTQFDLCYRREQHDLLNQALEQVSQRERQILSLYYEQDFTMKQIADELGVDESRVSQIHASLLGRLHKNIQAMLRGPALRPSLECSASAAQL